MNRDHERRHHRGGAPARERREQLRSTTRRLIAARDNAEIIWFKQPIALSRHAQTRIVGIAADVDSAVIEHWQHLADEQEAV
jgi:hypothetical protein